MGAPEDHDEKLPLTAELGDEGGSYADGAVQKETFMGGRGNERVDPKRVGNETVNPGSEAGAMGPSEDPPDMTRTADDRPNR